MVFEVVRLRWVPAIAAVGLLAGCGGEPAATESTTASSTSASSTLADTQTDPAIEFCEAAGGTVFGDAPMCGLPDGTSVDAWEYYRSQVNAGPAGTSASTTEPQRPDTTLPATTVPATSRAADERSL